MWTRYLESVVDVVDVAIEAGSGTAARWLRGIERHTTCGKPGCRCTANPPVLHGPYIQWTRKVGNKTVTKILSPEQRDRYQPWFDNARRVRELIAELEALSLHSIHDAENWKPA